MASSSLWGLADTLRGELLEYTARGLIEVVVKQGESQTNFELHHVSNQYEIY